MTDEFQVDEPFMSTYIIDALPPDDYEHGIWRIEVEWRPRLNKWAVQTLFRDILPPDSDEWISASGKPEHYYDTKEEAIARAKEVWPTFKVNGLTPAGVRAWKAERRRESGE